MIKCRGCGKELEDGSLFCDNCGMQVAAKEEAPETVEAVSEQNATEDQTAAEEAPKAEEAAKEVQPEQTQEAAGAFCPNCGTAIPAGSAFCPNCGANAVTGAVAEEAEQPKEKKKSKGLLIGIIAACAVVLVAVVGLIFVGGNKSSKADYTFYIKDKEVFYTEPGSKKPVQITEQLIDVDGIGNSELAYASSELRYYFAKSDDGSLIFYPDKISDDDDGCNLYYKKLSKADKEGQKIDSDIVAYSVNDAATLVTYIKDDGDLYSYNLKKSDKSKISGDVSNFEVSDDGKKVYYLNDEDELYVWKLGKDKEKIDSDVTKVCYNTDDLKTIYYMKEDSFYKKTEGKDKEKIASNVSAVLQVYDSGAAYYIKDNSGSQSISDFIVDDMAEEDLNTKEPEWPAYPSRYSYYSESAYNAAVAEYNKAKEEYDEKYQQYQEKLSRDKMRNALEDDVSFNLEQYELFYFDGKDEEKITEGFMGRYLYNTASDAEVIVYTALDTESFEKVKLSKFENIYDLESTITTELLQSANHYVAAGAKASVIDVEEGQNFVLNAKGDRVLFVSDVDSEKQRGDLYVVKINNGKVSAPELYDSDVYTGTGVYFTGSEHIRYFKDYDEENGDLYVDKKQADYDVYRYNLRYDKDNDKFYYYTDYDTSKQEGTLKVYKNGKSEKIADDVTKYELVDGNVYYLSEYSQKSYKGELYCYSGKKAKKVDDDVVGIMAAVTGRSTQGGAFRYGW